MTRFFNISFFLLSCAAIPLACGETTGPASDACPSQEPVAGSDCANQAQSCQYGVCSASQPQLVFTCTNGAWLVDEPRPCPPCPSNIVSGGVCDPTIHDMTCRLLNECSRFESATCESGQWVFSYETTGGASSGSTSATSTTGGAPQSTCPVNVVPTIGASCCTRGERCDYSDQLLALPISTGAGGGGNGASGAGGEAGSAGAPAVDEQASTCRLCNDEGKWERCD